jgi:hypothetical protein
VALTAVVALVASASLVFSRPADLRLDGRDLAVDVPPITTAHSKVFVPVRTLADALGADTKVNRKSGEISVVRGDRAVRLKIGDRHAKVNGEPMTLDTAPFRVRGRVMIGMKGFARAFGVRATYDRKAARVNVDTTGVVTANATIGQ